MNWSVYILKLSDDSYYTGISTNIVKRLWKHLNGKGSKYVKSRLPVRGVWCIEAHLTRSKALKFEAKIKKMSHKQKEELCLKSQQ